MQCATATSLSRHAMPAAAADVSFYRLRLSVCLSGRLLMSLSTQQQVCAAPRRAPLTNRCIDPGPPRCLLVGLRKAGPPSAS